MVFGEFHRVGAQPVLEVVTQFALLLQLERKGGGLSPEKLSEQLQPFPQIQFPAHRGQPGKVGEQVGAHPVEVGAGLCDVLLRHRQGDGALPDDAVAAARHLGEEHLVVLLPETVQAVAFHGQQDGILKLRPVYLPVADGDLRRSPGIQSVEKF